MVLWCAIAVHIETAFDANDELIAPDKSEYYAGTHIRHLWHCPKCSASFESIEQIPVEATTIAICQAAAAAITTEW
jgi:hypothetical protein